MAFIDWIRRCNRHDLGGFLPLFCDGIHLGWMHRKLLETLAGDDDVLVVDAGAVRLDPSLDTPAARTAALARLTARWRADGLLEGWRGEHYPAAPALGAAPLFSVERAAAPCLGLRCWGVHVNGYVRRGDGLQMWVAKRAGDRPVAPGKWDHLVAGGLPVGMGTRANLIKEAEEEAGLPAAIAATAVPTGFVSYCFVDPFDRLRPDTLLTWDLELPADFAPRNGDGEVERFELWPVERVAAAVRDGRDFKTNCNLVIIDFLVRHGLLAPDDTPDYEAIVAGLRRPFPEAAVRPTAAESESPA